MGFFKNSFYNRNFLQQNKISVFLLVLTFLFTSSKKCRVQKVLDFWLVVFYVELSIVVCLFSSIHFVSKFITLVHC